MPTSKASETRSMSGKWILSVEPAGPDENAIRVAKEKLLQQLAVKELTASKNVRLLTFKVVEEAKTEKSQVGEFNSFEAVIYDYSDNSSLTVRGRIDFSAPVSIKKAFRQPVYSSEEINHAREIASSNPAIKKLLDAKKVVLLPSMPEPRFQTASGLVSDRIISLVVKPVNPEEGAQIIGVNLNQERLIGPVVHFHARPELVNNLIHPVAMRWPIILPEVNSSDHVWFTIKDAASSTVLWKMLVVRPQASTGPAGSGLEIKYVDYKGKRVLFQMNAPIWNVLYKNISLQYRDWTNAEAGFNATGTPFKDANGNNLANFLLCNTKPTTIFETGTDGTFQGVAFFENSDGSWTLSTMMQAGWYRYYMGYTFFADGTIQPRLGFTTNSSNPHAGDLHIHHAYYRFDFDIGTSSKNIIQENSTQITPISVSPFIKVVPVHKTIVHEQNLLRGFLTHSHSVLEKDTNRGYQVSKGAADGTASGDSYAKGDIWALDYDGNEQYDNPSGTSCELDKFVNNESLDGADVVLWYGIHFSHEPGHTHGEKDFGPTLRPVNF